MALGRPAIAQPCKVFEEAFKAFNSRCDPSKEVKKPKVRKASASKKNQDHAKDMSDNKEDKKDDRIDLLDLEGDLNEE
jgi:isocitrate dehydrogenase kinase/phosphatase